MGCTSCSVTKNGVPQGCGDKGHCTSGSCNKKNTFDWLTTLDLHDPLEFHIVEISFKKGTRKGFYINPRHTQAITGDMVIVENSSGYDVGRISLSGDLVRLQMKKVNHDEEKVIHSVIRIANNRDLEKLDEARALDNKTMIKARKIARNSLVRILSEVISAWTITYFISCRSQGGFALLGVNSPLFFLERSVFYFQPDMPRST